MIKRVLLVDDDADIREALGQTLELADLEPVLAGSFVVAKDHIDAGFDGVIVTDIRMPGRDGFYLLDHVRTVDAELPVILLTGEGDIPMAVRAMAAGAFDFLEKPCAPQELLAVVNRALAARSLVLENRSLKRELANGDAAARMLFGKSALSDGLRDRVRDVAQRSGEVLVTSERGGGTPKVAEVIHLLSARSDEAFVKRVGHALDEATLAAAFVAAKGGTLYIDEVTSLSPASQFMLFDALETGLAVRIVAGSTKSVDDEMQQGNFRADLFYRLDLMRVHIPALRDRAEDIPVLFRHYVAQACEQANLPEPAISPEITARLVAQDWPGNARALMNAAMRFAMGLSDDPQETELGLNEQMARVERSLLVAALHRNSGKASDTAKELGLPRKTFYDKLVKHGIKPEDFRV